MGIKRFSFRDSTGHFTKALKNISVDSGIKDYSLIIKQLINKRELDCKDIDKKRVEDIKEKVAYLENEERQIKLNVQRQKIKEVSREAYDISNTQARIMIMIFKDAISTETIYKVLKESLRLSINSKENKKSWKYLKSITKKDIDNTRRMVLTLKREGVFQKVPPKELTFDRINDLYNKYHGHDKEYPPPKSVTGRGFFVDKNIK